MKVITTHLVKSAHTEQRQWAREGRQTLEVTANGNSRLGVRRQRAVFLVDFWMLQNAVKMSMSGLGS